MHKKVVFTQHLKFRMKIRKFPWSYPVMVYRNPDRRFYDNSEESEISIKRLKYGERLVNIMIAYTEERDFVRVFTIHPISDQQIKNRIESGRWTKK